MSPGAHRAARLGLRLLACAVVAACGGDATAPPPPPPPPPSTLEAPAFVFVADSAGWAQLFRFRGGTITRLTSEPANDVSPRAAVGRIVFTSDRDGNDEVYLADQDFATLRRVTNSAASDEEPALAPGGDTIVFASNRSGTPRLWLVAAPALDGGGAAIPAPVPLETGSAGWVPERAPAWSPDGTCIAFSSTRTGTSQVFVVSAAGGVAVQLSHEPAGAFQPAWSGDGQAVLYVTGAVPRVRRVPLAAGDAADFAADTLGVGGPSCDHTRCLAVTDPFGARGGIVVLSWGEAASRAAVATLPGARQPAVLTP